MKMKEGWRITMRKFKSLLCVLLDLVMVAALYGCGGSKPPAETTAAAPSAAPSAASSDAPAATKAPLDLSENVVYTIGVTDYLGRFIQGLTPSECPSAGYAVFDQVFMVDPVTKEVVSECLTDWYWEDDTTFIMVLNKNVFFSNGDKALRRSAVQLHELL
jgi:ABC-type transport system substrate-binding protein